MVWQFRLESPYSKEAPSSLQTSCQVRKTYYIFRAPNDTSNFSSYPESDTQSPALKPADDPFLEWWLSLRSIKI